MPVQIWTPTLPPADNTALATAIAGAGASLGRAIERLGEEHKRKNTQAKAVESFLGAMSDEDRAKFGVPDLTEFKNRSADDKIGFGLGLRQAADFRREQGNLDYMGALKRNMEARAEHEKAEDLNALKQPQFLELTSRYRTPSLQNLPPEFIGPPEEVPGLDLAGAAGRAARESGYTLPGAALSRLLDENGAAGHPTFFKSKPGELQPLRDETGALVPGHYLLPTGPNASQPFTKTDNSSQVSSYYDPVTGNSFYNTGGKNPRWLHLPQAKNFSEDELAAMHAEFKAASDPFAISIENAALPPAQRKTAAQRIEATAQKWAGRKPASGGAPSNYDAELKLAQDALKAGRDRKQVEALFQQRTGKPLPP